MSSRNPVLARSPLAQLTLARFHGMVREKEALFWTFGFPVLLAIGLGIAFRDRGPQKVFIGVAAGPAASSIATELGAEPGVETRILNPAEAQSALAKGDVALVVRSGADGTLSYQLDPTRPESRLAKLAANDALARASGRPEPAKIEPVTAHGSRYIDFLIPGLIGLNLLGAGMWGVGFALVKMREGKLLKRFLATPMKRSDFLMSFTLARLAFLVFELSAILIFAWLFFGVTVHGSLVALVVVAALGALSFSGLGLLVGSRAKTPEGVMGLVNVVSLPMWILSGVFFSSDHFPKAIQPLIEALPLTAVVDALRGIMTNGATLAALAVPITITIVWCIGSFAAALAIFRWR